MLLWLIIFLFMGIVSIVGLVYLVSRFRKFFPEYFRRQHKFISWLLAIVPVAIILFIFYAVFNITTMMVVIIHIIFMWMLCDFILWIITKVTKRELHYPYRGALALLLVVLYLGAGWYFGHHIYQTNYIVSTAKNLGQNSVRVVGVADSHLGITVDGERFARQMQRIQDTNPDLVVIVGDFVDDDTEKDDMIRACQALGELKTTYGVYFVFGNHDEGYYRYRNFTSQDLRAALLENNVIIMEDEAVLLHDSFYLIGRKDRSMRGREETVDIVADLDPNKYMIVLDHQPNDYAGEAAAGVDLVFSGHTHGGHIYPAGLIGLVIGANDNVYGQEQRDSTQFIVTSGISGWAIPFKTGTISEYVVIDIIGAKA